MGSTKLPNGVKMKYSRTLDASLEIVKYNSAKFESFLKGSNVVIHTYH